MPLTELLKIMSKGKQKETQESVVISNDPFRRRDPSCVELVWENGQLTAQGQSSRERRNRLINNPQIVVHKTREIRNINESKVDKFGTIDPVMADFPMPVASNGMGLGQGVDMAPWLSYPIEDPMPNVYNTSDFLNELSEVTTNDLSLDRNSGLYGDGTTNIVDESVSIKDGDQDNNTSILHPFQHLTLSSDICNASGYATSESNHVTSLDSVRNKSPLCAFTNMRLQRLYAGSNFSNFSYFVQPKGGGSANHLSINSPGKLENDDTRGAMFGNINQVDSTMVDFQQENFPRNTSVFPSVNLSSEVLPTKPNEEHRPSNQAVCHEENARNDASPNQGYGVATTIVGESNMGQVVATSSAGSGNTIERASSEPTRVLKRKCGETGEIKRPNEEHESESEGARKSGSARAGSKRSRAAEVHNESERKRRDRINEKMRALQELIPNCNKVDKASMLDEAIDYLKTLQQQVQNLMQMFSAGAGLYMHPMMLQPGMQSNHGAQMPHLSPMGGGMYMGYGMNMLNMSGGMKMMPVQGPHYPVPAGPANQGMPNSNLQGHPSQGFPMIIQRAPVGVPPMKLPLPNVMTMAGSTVATTRLAPSSSSKDAGQQVMPSHNVNVSMTHASIQARIEGIAAPHDQPQAHNASGDVIASTRKRVPNAMPNRD